MNAFEQTHAIVNEAANGFDLLRIIAKDTHGLSKDDRASINGAADELEHAQRALVKLYFEYGQLQQKLIAVTDQLLDVRKEIAEKRLKLPQVTLTIGPVAYSPWRVGAVP